MNLHRQQGVGNIIAALWAGRNVYLGNSSVLTDYQKKGLDVLSYKDEFDLGRALPSGGQLKARRKCIESMMGNEAVFRSISDLLEKLSSN
jgi:hypothetical protein